MIIDETKHMLKLDTKFGEKLIPKKICTFEISNHNNTTNISGTKLHNRSHERLEDYSMTRDIGIKVKAPKQEPDKTDNKNPFNGTLSVRGKLFEGTSCKK